MLLSLSPLAPLPLPGGLATALPRLSSRAHPPRPSIRALASPDTELLPQAYFQALEYSKGGVPWDLQGRPQPPVRSAAQEGSFGPVGTSILDCGCGAGDNANWLAARGYDVVGFDFCSSAIATAVERSSSPQLAAAMTESGGSVEFVEASALDLRSADRLHKRARELGGFATALDSALLHCLDDEAQQRYLRGLRELMRSEGRLYVGCFSDANPDPWSNPRRLSKEQVRFAKSFTILTLHS